MGIGVQVKRRRWGSHPGDTLMLQGTLESTLACRVQGSGFRVQGLVFIVKCSVFSVRDSGFRVQGPGFTIQGSARARIWP